MNLFRPRTLKWRLIGRLALVQGMVLVGLLGINSLLVSVLWVNGDLGTGYSLSTAEVLADAVSRDVGGRLVLRDTPPLARLRKDVDGLWFVIQDERGARIGEGTVPAEVVPLLSSLDRIENASIGRRVAGEMEPLGIVQSTDTAAGKVHMIADVRGAVSVQTVFFVLGSTFGIILFVIGIMAFTTLIVTPFVVRRALAGLSAVADQAARIDIKRIGVRLPTADVPSEVEPLVGAVNDALGRLDRDYERHRRFLTDAAHELRTPIAILSTRIAGLPKGQDRTKLLEDTSRLNTLAGQLLDLQRLEQPRRSFAPVDIIAVAQRVVLEIAPLAFEGGYEIAFDADADAISIEGDEGAIERVVTNLLQNAIDYGGHRGTIDVRVIRPATIQVCDDGDGIALDQQDMIFEPFHRLTRGGRGAGLGLDLVRRTMRVHGGTVEIGAGPTGGACVRLVFSLTC